MTDFTELQEQMERTYGERDRARGIPATVAWLASLANQLDVTFEEAVARYRDGCPRCGAVPCECPG